MKRLTLLTATVLFLVIAPATEARTFLTCNPTTQISSIQIKPKWCPVMTYNASPPEAVNLGRIRWGHWGKRRAYFRAISKGFHLPYGKVRVRGFAFRPRRDQCGGRIWLFTRVLVRTWRGKRVVRAQSCYGYD